jgi:hypothetical protein
MVLEDKIHFKTFYFFATLQLAWGEANRQNNEDITRL